jgi:hypothetical protein
VSPLPSQNQLNKQPAATVVAAIACLDRMRRSVCCTRHRRPPRDRQSHVCVCLPPIQLTLLILIMPSINHPATHTIKHAHMIDFLLGAAVIVLPRGNLPLLAAIGAVKGAGWCCGVVVLWRCGAVVLVLATVAGAAAATIDVSESVSACGNCFVQVLPGASFGSAAVMQHMMLSTSSSRSSSRRARGVQAPPTPRNRCRL